MGNSAFTEMMLTDLIPMIEKTYRALPGAANRAMAGLSMGGDARPVPPPWPTSTSSPTSACSAAATFPCRNIKNPAAFKKQIKAVFFGNGQAEGGTAASKPAAEELKKAGINAVFYESPRTAHEFLTWRRCLREFAPLLFR